MQNYMLAQNKKIEITKKCENYRIEDDPEQVFILNWSKKKRCRISPCMEPGRCCEQ